jgi:hypothetical protein
MGVALDPSSGALFVTNYNTNTVCRVPAGGGACSVISRRLRNAESYCFLFTPSGDDCIQAHINAPAGYRSVSAADTRCWQGPVLVDDSCVHVFSIFM